MLLEMNNINKYKKALVYTREIREILTIISQVSLRLDKYKKYNQVVDILNTLNDSKLVLNTHLNNQEQIVKTKGAE